MFLFPSPSYISLLFFTDFTFFSLAFPTLLLYLNDDISTAFLYQSPSRTPRKRSPVISLNMVSPSALQVNKCWNQLLSHISVATSGTKIMGKKTTNPLSGGMHLCRNASRLKGDNPQDIWLPEPVPKAE